MSVLSVLRTSVLAALVSPLVAWLLLRHFRRLWSSRAPGPPGLPLLGNLFQMPASQHWLVFSKWAKSYGDVIYLTVLGQPILVLESGRAALDLFDKRSNIYSDRPYLTMAGELCGMQRIAPLTRFGRPLQEQRRMMQRILNQRIVRSYEAIQRQEISNLIRNIHLSPESFINHIKRMAGRTIMEIIYGKSINAEDDKLVRLAEQAMIVSTRAGTTAWAVDFLPFLKYLPEWFPGTNFKKLANEWRKIMEDSVHIPFKASKDSIEAGNDENSMISIMLKPEDDEVIDEKRERLIEWTANSLYAAGADTTAATITTFILAMTLHPHVQARAQAELDSIIGSERLPTLDDRERLPYIGNLVDECYRWGVPVPLTPPRLLMEDDEYRGWLIPKGTLCMSDIWSMLRDKAVYENPDDFWPERFSEVVSDDMKKIRDPRTYIFGFGRRRCPGLHLADASVWLAVATILSVFIIERCTSADGSDIIPEVKYSSDQVIRHPMPFECRFRLRNDMLRISSLGL